MHNATRKMRQGAEMYCLGHYRAGCQLIDSAVVVATSAGRVRLRKQAISLRISMVIAERRRKAALRAAHVLWAELDAIPKSFLGWAWRGLCHCWSWITLQG